MPVLLIYRSVAGGKLGAGGASAALSKVAAFTSKFSTQHKTIAGLSDSDLDMDISLDEDVRTVTF